MPAYAAPGPTTYDLTTGVMLDIEDLISILDPYDVPLLGTAGADGRSTLTTGTCFEKKVEWLDESLLTPRSSLGNTCVTADTYITVATGTQAKFTTGDVVLIDSEHMRVTGYGSTADTLTVAARPWVSTETAAQHSNAVVVVGVGTALPEGSDPSNSRAVDRTDRFNFTQIFGPIQIQISGSENVVRKYGLGGTTEFDHQVANRLKEIGVSMEQGLLYGTRLEDTVNKLRTMGGMAYYIQTNVDSTTTQLTDVVILNDQQTVYDAGGQVDRITLGSKQKRVLSAVGSANIRFDRADNGRGQVIDYIDTDFGRVSAMLNRWCRTSDLFGYARDQAEVDTLRPLVFEALAKTGDSMKGQIVCEKTLKFRREKHAFRHTALT